MDLVNILPALESIARSINFGPLNDLLAKIRQFVDRIILFITPDAPVRDAGLAMAGYADSVGNLITRLGNSLPELHASYTGPAADQYYASAEQALQLLQKLQNHLNGAVDRHTQLAEHFAEALLQQGMLVAQGAIMAVDLGSLIFTGGLDAPVSVPVAAGDAVVADGTVVAMDAAVDAADAAVGAIGESASEIGDMAFDLGDEGADVLADGDTLAGDGDLLGDPEGTPTDNPDDFTFNKDPGQAASDGTADAYGPAWENNPEEYQQIMDDLNNSGVKVNLNEDTPLGQGGYGPSSTPGEPGSFTVNPDADISTLGHEYEHFLMDRELGYPGMRAYLQDPELMMQGEARAYDTEIARALADGNTDLAQILEDAKQACLDGIRERWGLP